MHSGFKRTLLLLFLCSALFFFESSGGSFLISSLQNIERQFQIPSKISGFLLGATEFGYIPTIVIISYIGSRLNRARCLAYAGILMAVSYILISSPNFVFRATPYAVGTNHIQNALKPSSELLKPNVTLLELLNYAPLQNEIPLYLRWRLFERLQNRASLSRRTANNWSDSLAFMDTDMTSLYLAEKKLKKEIVKGVMEFVNGTGSAEALRRLMSAYPVAMNFHLNENSRLVERAVSTSVEFCSSFVNELREHKKLEECNMTVRSEGPLGLMFVGLVMLGISRTAPWTLGIPLLDDNVPKSQLPIYFTGVSLIRILGPVSGYAIGSVCNKIYYDYDAPDGLSASDPSWIGAWWLGFLVLSVLTFIPAMVLCLLSNRYDHLEKKTTAISICDHKDISVDLKKNGSWQVSIRPSSGEFRDKSNYKSTTGMETKNIPLALLHSKIFVGSVIARLLDQFAFRGYTSFVPKYLEYHYGIPQFRSNQLIAIFGVVGFAIGASSGGFLTKRFMFKGRNAAVFVFIMSSVHTICILLKAFLGCHSMVTTVGQTGQALNFNYTTTCNSECGCSQAALAPVCDQFGMTFFSACHAGCKKIISLVDFLVLRIRPDTTDLQFTDCACSPGQILARLNCHDDCFSAIVAFFALGTLGSMANGICLVPATLLLLRSVPHSLRSIGLGVQGFFVALLGTLPAPFVWGALVDTACILWTSSCNHQHGACSIYDPTSLRYRMHFTYVLLKVLSLSADIFIIYHANDVVLMSEADDKAIGDKSTHQTVNDGNEQWKDGDRKPTGACRRDKSQRM
ncbi:hypothetical protein AB6A40_000397 [Gnathostoma spinigerum]|uniref:Solute carrier organic anion transporter family member n=1 Tax=Gnathostoma spinigerum TaxID=75299 RepID=A0ABD6E230_9BILA